MKKFHLEGNTLSYEFRKKSLLKLFNEISNQENNILKALHNDLGKSQIEAYTSEVYFTLTEIKHAVKHLKRWMKPKTVKTPLLYFPAKSQIIPTPKGVVLIIGPWNYPFQLVVSPLIGSIAAGNCAVLKPSEYAPQTAKIIKSIISKIFEPDHCLVVQGDHNKAIELTNQKWDHLFFTGSTEIARSIMQSASKYLTPVTLELGGKSPCIVNDDIDLNVSAKRIIWGKFMNAGQTCVAPDTLYCHENIYEQLIEEMKKTLKEFYGENPLNNPDYSLIINSPHVKRLASYLDGSTIITGGHFNEENRIFEPTLIKNIPADSIIMKEEIFGPILPLIPYKEIDHLTHQLQHQPRPLSLYIFSKNKFFQDKIIRSLPSGSIGINETIKQITVPDLPFGGTGDSGIGQYHGKYSFDCFTQYRSVLKNGFCEPGLHFPPYKNSLTMLKKIFKLMNSF